LWDLNKVEKQTELLFSDVISFNITDLAWNRKVPHIVAVSASNGKVSILDLRSKKAVVGFSLPGVESNVSSISWNPESPTQIIAANADDASPHLYLWDLKSPNSAQSTFTGHSKGILSTSWSSPALLSSSRDGAVIAWNTQSGEFVKEVEKRHEAVFSVNWCPSDSNVFASCALDGKVNIFSYQAALNIHQESELKKSCEFKIPYESEQGPPPIGAVFGPGSVCSVFRANRRDVALVKIVTNECKVAAKEVSAFESLLANTDTASICKSLIESSDGDDNSQNVWKLLSLLFAQDFNGELLDFIGAKNHQYPPIQSSNPQQSSNKEPFKLLSAIDSEIDQSITEKLVAFDVRGSVSDCLAAKRFADALVIASCYDSELREEVEHYIFEHSTSSYMRVARALRFHDFTDLIDNWPCHDWKDVVSLIIHHAPVDKSSEFYSRLAERLSSEADAFSGAAVAFLLAGDLYRFAERLMFGLAKDSPIDGDLMNQFSSIFNAYRFIRLLQFYSHDVLNTITEEVLKNRILDVLLKLKYILYLSGSESTLNSHDFTQFSSQFTGKDVNLDLMIEKLFNCEEDICYETSQADYSQSAMHQVLPAQSYNPTDSLSLLSTSQVLQPETQLIQQMPPQIQPIQPLQQMQQIQSAPLMPQQFQQMSFQAIKPNPPTSPTWSPEGSPKTYNDAPIIKPRGSTLLPDIINEIGSMEISGIR
jgi:hypothetical protein